MKLLLPILALPLIGMAAMRDPEVPTANPVQDDEDQAALVKSVASAGIHLDLEHELVAFPVSIEVRDDLLEYLLTMPHGAAHETMFMAGLSATSTEEAIVWAQVLNASLLALGVEPGENAQWVEKEPAPTPEQQREGISPYDVLPPQGDGFYMYAAWKEADELFLYRLEDLIRDLDRQRAMRRHKWVFLGSRMVTQSDGSEAFAAGHEGNLINVSFFPQGNTLLTGALPECLNQTTWLPNAWLLPERGSVIHLILSRERLQELPEDLAQQVPTVR